MTPARLIRIRHAIQWGLLAGFVLLPFTGLFRVDVSAGRFLIGPFQIWWDDFAIVFGFWATIFFSMTAFYSNFGMIFCGWMCPQHTFSEWLNGLARRLLGRRVLAEISPERAAGRSIRKKGELVAAWTAFIAVVLLVSAVLTLAVLAYFFEPAVIFDHLTGAAPNLYVAVFLLLLGTFILVDVGLLRHFWCKYMCPYGLWQYMFHGRDTLQIRFDTAREDDCKTCSLCRDVCPMDLEPTQPEVYTRCINCAICIDACDSYMGRFGKRSLLSFGFGTKKEELIRIETGRSRVLAPSVLWPVTGVAMAVALFVYGLMTFQPVKLVVHQDELLPTGGIAFHAVIVNKDGRSRTVTTAVEGLPEGAVRLSGREVTLGVGEERTVPFAVAHESLALDTPYEFILRVTRTDTGRSYRDSAVYYRPDLDAVADN